MSLLLLAAGAVFAVLFLLTNLFRTDANRPTAGTFRVVLILLTVGATAAALIANHAVEASDPQIDTLALLLGGGLALINLIALLVNTLHRETKRGRWLPGVIGGVLIAAISLLIPLAAAYLDIGDITTPTATPVARATAEASGEATPEITVEPTPVNRAVEVYMAVRDVLSAEINADDVTISLALDAGQPLAQIVREYNGDLERVIDGIAEVVRPIIRAAAANGELGQLQAALLLSQMETLVRLAVNSDINRFIDSIGARPTPAPGETQGSIFLIITASPSPETGTPPAAVTPAPIVPTSEG